MCESLSRCSWTEVSLKLRSTSVGGRLGPLGSRGSLTQPVGHLGVWPAVAIVRERPGTLWFLLVWHWLSGLVLRLLGSVLSSTWEAWGVLIFLRIALGFQLPAWTFFCCGDGGVVVVLGGGLCLTSQKDESFPAGGLRHFDLYVCFFGYLTSFEAGFLVSLAFYLCVQLKTAVPLF